MTPADFGTKPDPLISEREKTMAMYQELLRKLMAIMAVMGEKMSEGAAQNQPTSRRRLIEASHYAHDLPDLTADQRRRFGEVQELHFSIRQDQAAAEVATGVNRLRLLDRTKANLQTAERMSQRLAWETAPLSGDGVATITLREGCESGAWARRYR